jgi:hypothetical protein
MKPCTPVGDYCRFGGACHFNLRRRHGLATPKTTVQVCYKRRNSKYDRHSQNCNCFGFTASLILYYTLSSGNCLLEIQRAMIQLVFLFLTPFLFVSVMPFIHLSSSLLAVNSFLNRINLEEKQKYQPQYLL